MTDLIKQYELKNPGAILGGTDPEHDIPPDLPMPASFGGIGSEDIPSDRN